MLELNIDMDAGVGYGAPDKSLCIYEWSLLLCKNA